MSESQLQELVTAAAAAPSVHNSQPWRFKVYPDRAEVYADPARLLQVADPSGRELLISCGAAVLNLRVAVRAFGWEASVRLLPKRTDPRHVATVAVGRPISVSAEDRALYAAVFSRHTQRGPFENRGPAQAVLDQLSAAAAEEGASLSFLEPADRDAVLAVIRSAEDQLRRDPAYARELGEWTHDGGRDAGVPSSAFAPLDGTESLPVRDFAVGGLQPTTDSAVPYETSPVMAVLSTAGDGLLDWLRAGQALQRTWLTATACGLVASMFTQPLEVPELRNRLADRCRPLRPQMVLRVGYGSPTTATPRRVQNDVMGNPEEG